MFKKIIDEIQTLKDFSEDVNETCHCLVGKDFVTKKCLLLDNKQCNCMALSA